MSYLSKSMGNAPPQVDAAIMKDVARLLAGRTRDIRLRGPLLALFRQRTWKQTAKIVRDWMMWVLLLDVLTLGIYALFLPQGMVSRMAVPAVLVLPTAMAVVAVFRKPLSPAFQGVTLLGGIFLILMLVSLTGVQAGGEFYERHQNIMLSVAITAIIMFPIPFWWTLSIAVGSLAIYLAFQLQNPALETFSSLVGTLFFASGIIATVVARRTMTIIAQKSFLLELQGQARLDELAEANKRLELLAVTDPLTGIANRRSMIDMLDRLWQDGRREAEATAMLMCDIDEFKRLNDSLGHSEGDRCLVKVAGIIQSCLRDDRDLVARYGGEEFLVLLPGVALEEALTLAERIRARVEAASLPNPLSGTAPHVTVSIGVAGLPSGATLAPEVLQQRADQALYRAKKSGRNRVTCYEPV